MGRMSKPVQRGGGHSAYLECLAISEKELRVETCLKKI